MYNNCHLFERIMVETITNSWTNNVLLRIKVNYSYLQQSKEKTNYNVRFGISLLVWYILKIKHVLEALVFRTWYDTDYDRLLLKYIHRHFNVSPDEYCKCWRQVATKFGPRISPLSIEIMKSWVTKYLTKGVPSYLIKRAPKSIWRRGQILLDYVIQGVSH